MPVFMRVNTSHGAGSENRNGGLHGKEAETGASTAGVAILAAHVCRLCRTALLHTGIKRTTLFSQGKVGAASATFLPSSHTWRSLSLRGQAGAPRHQAPLKFSLA